MYAKSEYSVSRFFTPPAVKPLKLDLAELSGGGSTPAQYYGETHDGREVYCRYRGGHLTIEIANAPGKDALDDGTLALKADIGPPLDGAMSLSQLCEYAGLTINGLKPPPDDPARPDRENIGHDLSGATTFYDVWVASTHDTQRTFFSRIREALPDAVVAEPVLDDRFHTVSGRICSNPDEITQSFVSIIASDQIDPRRVAAWTTDNRLETLFPDALIFGVMTSGFQYPVMKYGNNDAAWIRKVWGRDVEIAGQCDDMLHNSFSVHTKFATADDSKRQLVERFDRFFDRIYPAFRVRRFDINSGEEDTGFDLIQHHDLAIADWVGDNPDRWLHIDVEGDRDNPVAMGMRLEAVEPPDV